MQRRRQHRLLEPGSRRVAFIPADTADYNSVAVAVKIMVRKSSPQITTVPTASPITNGQALADSTLAGGIASAAGNFAFTAPSTRPKATAEQSVKFTPADAADYEPVNLTVVVPVNLKQTNETKMTPSIRTAPTATAITYGQTLADSILAGGEASTTGRFAFTTPSAAPHAGTEAQNVTFTPNDSRKYFPVFTSVTVTVNKATPRITAWPAASALTYGQTLADSVLSGGEASSAGRFAFTTPSVIPKVGANLQSVTFTPADLTDYRSVTTNVTVTVYKYPVVITKEPTASAITYGQTLADSVLSSGVASTAGTFAFTSPSTMPKPGTSPQSVTFTPADLTGYSAATTSVNVTVNKATPRITVPPVASRITNGQALANSLLSGGEASTPGGFAFTTPSIIPKAGTNLQSVTFAPRNTADFTTAACMVPVNAIVVDLHPPITKFGMDFVWVKGIHAQGAFVQTTELSQKQYFKLAGKLPDQKQHDIGDDLPVDLSFEAASKLCQKLNAEMSDGQFALPSREDFLSYSEVGDAGSQAPATDNPATDNFTNLLRSLDANTLCFDWNANAKIRAVGEGKVNRFGLLNVLGNAWEWCDDHGVGVPAGLSYGSTGLRSSKRLFAEGGSITPENDVVGVRLLYLPAPAAH